MEVMEYYKQKIERIGAKISEWIKIQIDIGKTIQLISDEASRESNPQLYLLKRIKEEDICLLYTSPSPRDS